MLAQVPLSLGVHVLLAVAAWVWLSPMRKIAEAAYDKVGAPLSQAAAQLTFSATALASYFDTIVGAEKVDAYRHSQTVDFGLIASIGVALVLTATLPLPWRSTPVLAIALCRVALWLTLAYVILDSAENLVSLWLLQARPLLTWQALVYSSLAAAKLVSLLLAAVTALAGCALALSAARAI